MTYEVYSDPTSLSMKIVIVIPEVELRESPLYARGDLRRAFELVRQKRAALSVVFDYLAAYARVYENRVEP